MFLDCELYFTLYISSTISFFITLKVAPELGIQLPQLMLQGSFMYQWKAGPFQLFDVCTESDDNIVESNVCACWRCC